LGETPDSDKPELEKVAGITGKLLISRVIH
jgi:hypothetical protein